MSKEFLLHLAKNASALALWAGAYLATAPLSQWISYGLLGLEKNSSLGHAAEFFFYDTPKILLLLVLMVYVIAWLRAGLDTDRIREYLKGKRRGLGYLLGAVFGAITPFCSCSSIPLFIGFMTARIPMGIAMAFLITSPIINELAVVLLWGMLGWKFTAIYVGTGLAAGILGGLLMDSLHTERWLQSSLLEDLKRPPMRMLMMQAGHRRITPEMRHSFAISETRTIFRRVWKWVIVGVAVGAGLHGFVPQDWFARNFSAGQWWTVPLASAVGIPLYTNVTGVVPVMESLLLKGLPAGTTLAFCMSSVAASLPEVIMLKQVMQGKLLVLFLGFLFVVFTVTGWLLNCFPARVF